MCAILGFGNPDIGTELIEEEFACFSHETQSLVTALPGESTV